MKIDEQFFKLPYHTQYILIRNFVAREINKVHIHWNSAKNTAARCPNRKYTYDNKEMKDSKIIPYICLNTSTDELCVLFGFEGEATLYGEDRLRLLTTITMANTYKELLEGDTYTCKYKDAPQLPMTTMCGTYKILGSIDYNFTPIQLEANSVDKIAWMETHTGPVYFRNPIPENDNSDDYNDITYYYEDELERASELVHEMEILSESIKVLENLYQRVDLQFTVKIKADSVSKKRKLGYDDLLFIVEVRRDNKCIHTFEMEITKSLDRWRVVTQHVFRPTNEPETKLTIPTPMLELALNFALYLDEAELFAYLRSNGNITWPGKDALIIGSEISYVPPRISHTVTERRADKSEHETYDVCVGRNNVRAFPEITAELIRNEGTEEQGRYTLNLITDYTHTGYFNSRATLATGTCTVEDQSHHAEPLVMGVFVGDIDFSDIHKKAGFEQKQLRLIVKTLYHKMLSCKSTVATMTLNSEWAPSYIWETSASLRK